MTYIIYADVMFFSNMVINAVLLYVTSKLLCISIRPYRLIIWSALTGFILEIIYISTLNFNLLFHNIIYILMYMFMIFAYFKCKSLNNFLKSITCVTASNFFLFGLINTFSINDKITIQNIFFYSVLIIIIFSFLYNKHTKKDLSQFYNIEINFMNNKIKSCGFMDSGNMLEDYFTGAPVIILDYRITKKILKPEAYKYILMYCQSGVFDYEKLKEHVSFNFYPIPYRTISDNCSIMPGFKLKSVIFPDYDAEYKNVVACISRYKLSRDNSYMALLNEKIKPNREEYSND